MRKLTHALTLALVISSVAIEWLFLTGAPLSQRALAETFLPAAPAAQVLYLRPNFQTGVVFPRWGANAYTSSDRNYGIGLGEIQNQTGARWVELTIELRQLTYNSTTVYADPLSTTPASLAEGIAAAHAQGFKVFIEPLLSLDMRSPSRSYWGGVVTFPKDSKSIGAWFEGYWQAFKPYLVAAQRAGADQVAVGTELEGMENVPDIYWYWLIAQMRTAYSGRLTYDINYTSFAHPIPAWLRDPTLAAVGVSVYITIANAREPIPWNSVADRWAATAGNQLDTFAMRLGRPIFISEIGFRNASDALSHPFQQSTLAPPDPQLQAAAYNAALLYAMSDPRISGIYFWAWSLPPFSPNWLPAAHALKSWYTSPLA